MKQASLMIQINLEMKISWCSPEVKVFYPDSNQSSFQGQTVYDLFDQNDSEFKKFYRWTTNVGRTDESFKLVLNSSEEKSLVHAWSSNENLYLRIFNDINVEKDKEFKSYFWDFFAKTFPGGFLFLTNDNHIYEISKAMVDFLDFRDRNDIQYSKQAILSKNFFQLLETQNDKELGETISKAIELNSQSSETFEVPVLLRYNDKIFKVILNSIFEKKERLGACLYFFDVTKEIDQKKALEKQKEQLFNSAKLASLGEMAAGVAHEINNPLSIISGSMTLLERGLKDETQDIEKIRGTCKTVNETVIRIAKIIKGLKALARSSGDDDYEDYLFSLLIENIQGVSNRKMGDQKINFNIKQGQGCDQIYINCDSVQISQILLNLVNNAADAVEEQKDQSKKWIILETEISGDSFILKVTDSGDGICNKIRHKIFMPFYTSKAVGKGTGLGLSISSKIAIRHKGTLSIDEQAQNTCFKLVLPITRHK